MWARDGVTDEYVFNVVRNGIPGSIMPPHGLNETELWMLIAFMATLAEGAETRNSVGMQGMAGACSPAIARNAIGPARKRGAC